MSVTVVERVIDEKRRVTLPPDANLAAGSKVAVVSSSDFVIIAKDPALVGEVTDLLQGREVQRRLRALEEWTGLVKEAGHLGLSSKEIEARVGEAMRRPRQLGS